MTDEARRIAEGLTEAQRRGLTAHIKGYYHAWPGSARDQVSFQNAGRSLMDARLIKWHPDPRKTLTTLTGLGLAVRAALEKGGNDGR